MSRRDEMAERRVDVLEAAAERWQQKISQVDAADSVLRTHGRLAATSAVLGNAFLQREERKSYAIPEMFIAEAIIGDTIDFTDTAPDETAANAGRPVARIVDRLDSDQDRAGFATGFLVAPQLFVTNWHVFADPGNATDCGAQFGYEVRGGSVADPGVTFDLDPDSFFISNQELDIAIVGVSAVAPGAALRDQGNIGYSPAPGKYLVGNPINIIQHPDGKPKRWAVSNNGIRVEPADDDLFLQYFTDTLAGSSGSPAFNHDWELVAVHHGGVPHSRNGRILRKDGTPWSPLMAESEIDWAANEGVRISKVHAYLAGLRLTDPGRRALLDQLLGVVGTQPVPEAAARPLTPRPSEQIMDRPTVNVVVNGTANFYLDGKDHSETSDVLTTPPSPLPAPIADVTPTIVEKKLRFDRKYEARPGYDSGFLEGFTVPAPKAPEDEIILRGGVPFVLNYHHYSLTMNIERQLAMWTACNADYDQRKRRKAREEFGIDTWKSDPRIPDSRQLEDTEFYAPAVKFDRGHLVRRDDVAWGETAREEEFGNSDSFHWTNCTPQHEGFNRDMFEYDGLWGALENHITRQARSVGNKCIIFAGPVLDHDDPLQDFGDEIVIKVPRRFWKVIVAAETLGDETRLGAYGFVLDQTEAIEKYGWESRFNVGMFKQQQRSLADITGLTRVTFDDQLYDADPLGRVGEESGSRQLLTLDDVLIG
ncbi:DNA/RNA non-specific endonuclease [Mycolicibacterium baixiangningiae]|uniref:DNA/RNA non-specific endonuclease n=1 Tax=Mycolicibacterium baixiangningiae TaxID=2761578 RepID=UPI001865F8AC|nr:DNA/RNA non-specific endonuclease [Mycolicibacterium baixiangningiae]